MKMRFVGGHMQGVIKDVREGEREVMTLPPFNSRAMVTMADDFLAVPLRPVRYVCREVNLAGMVRLDVFCLHDMSTAEFWRRVADIIEGV